ncbi:hypothetical protein [Dyella acidisoli]|uniref:4-vinyl reductase 4VR domain-containing protein n=1 Tax=Dyella acidisoli TaxID=1867834 RepID=A0ABQ5XKC1_9GAMM|nr:hypothetical protein [Dyella acidisoli]GLQ92058.1 hypothetical protein GCM10007901_10090 [Dyella acidisoli]
MIELELQALSLSREGLLMDVGRVVAASGFALVRQRLVDDRNGVLLTMVVRGPERKQRALEATLDKHERIISFEVSPFVDGPPKPHFAAARSVAKDYVPPPPPAPAPAPIVESKVPKPAETKTPNFQAGVALVPHVRPVSPAFELVAPEVSEATPAPAPKPEPLPEPEPEFDFMRASVPAPAPVVAEEPFVEMVQLEADQAAVEKLLPKLMDDYPQIFPLVKKLEQSVQPGARESSLLLVGQRVGAWVFQRQHALNTKMDLEAAMTRVGVPALSALLEVEYSGNQLHIRNSPLCAEDGHSGCKFLSGYLEGLLGPVIASQGLSIFEVCCRSFGADECVLAVMD